MSLMEIHVGFIETIYEVYEMRVLEIIYSLSSGGAERFVVDLANNLAGNKDNDVTILTVCDIDNSGNAHYKADINEKVRFVNLGRKKGLTIASLISVCRVIRQLKPDVVHCHSNLILLYLPALFCKSPRYVHTLHSLADKCLRWRWCKPINRHFYSSKVQAVTISRECSRSYRQLYGLDNDEVIINGREKVQLTVDAEKVREEVCSLTRGKQPVFINVARCAQEKNHKLLFDVFERLSAEGSDAQLLVVGAGHEDNMVRYKSHPNIHVIGERKNVADYLAQADYFILSSIYEGLPLTLLEAMSMGVIPVCTPAGGIKDVIRDGENGYMTKGFSDEEFYSKIKQAMSESDRISRDMIIHEYHEKYSMGKCADNYKTIYQLGKDCTFVY